MHNSRKTLRLPFYNYSNAGFYFITICTQNRMKYFGDIEGGKLNLNYAGEMVEQLWADTSSRFNTIVLHEFIVMPNHFHAILEIQSLEKKTYLGEAIGAFKSLTTNAYIDGVKMQGWQSFEKKLWQRNYYEHIIRNEESYKVLTEYILNNPQQWRNDEFYM
jgi:REP element-mobilizing transposase RayT